LASTIIRIVLLTSALELEMGAPQLRADPATPIKGTAYVTSWFGGVVSVIDLASPSASAILTSRCVPIRTSVGHEQQRKDLIHHRYASK
jgi:hypothetical protein